MLWVVVIIAVVPWRYVLASVRRRTRVSRGAAERAGRFRYAISLIYQDLEGPYPAEMREGRIFLVDDHAGFRRAATDFLTSSGCRVVATARSGEEALEGLGGGGGTARRGAPRLSSCRGSTVSTSRCRIASLREPPPVILISSYADAAADPRVRSAAARGFLNKQDLTCDAIRALLA